RLDRFGADPSRVAVLAYPSNPTPDWFAHLEQIRERYPTRPLVTVVDGLLKFSGLDDENDSARWEAWFNGVTPTLRRLHVTAFYNHHAKKSDGRYRGSSAIAANVDYLLE